MVFCGARNGRVVRLAALWAWRHLSRDATSSATRQSQMFKPPLCSHANTIAAPTCTTSLPYRYTRTSIAHTACTIDIRLTTRPRTHPLCSRTQIYQNPWSSKASTRPTATSSPPTPPQWHPLLSLRQQQEAMLTHRAERPTLTGKHSCYSVLNILYLACTYPP